MSRKPMRIEWTSAGRLSRDVAEVSVGMENISLGGEVFLIVVALLVDWQRR